MRRIELPESANEQDNLGTRSGSSVINQIVVGELGKEEILLVARDDSRITACECASSYAAHPIATLLTSMPSKIDYTKDFLSNITAETACNTEDSIRPFLHERVRSSAWSIAIHKRSQLIAVGTNDRSVEVFAFGLNTPSQRCSAECVGEAWPVVDNTLPLNAKPDVEADHVFQKGSSILSHTDGSICRLQNFKIVIPLEPRLGHNIPAIDFADDENGNAVVIVAKDVRGALWILSIWTGEWQRYQTVKHNDGPDRLVKPE